MVAQLRRAWDIIADQPATDIVLRFRPDVAGRVMEASWHPSQRVAELADGSLEWRATVAGTIEIRLWILSWGSDVEVLAPRRSGRMSRRRSAVPRASTGPTPDERATPSGYQRFGDGSSGAL